MRKKTIIGNWKMNKNTEQSTKFIQELNTRVHQLNTAQTDIIIAPPFTSLYTARQILNNSSIKYAGQTLSKHEEGAYTGEISANMLTNLGCTHVLVGHSERRLYQHESNEDCNKQLQIALKHNLIPVYCVGESLEERDNNQTLSVIKTQLDKGLENLEFNAENLIIAYEPVWAIGTGKVASPEQAQDVHAFIRKSISTLKNNKYADNTSILYGGSVKPTNIKDLIQQPDIDGALVGGACLDSDSFIDIVTTSTHIHVT